MSKLPSTSSASAALNAASVPALARRSDQCEDCKLKHAHFGNPTNGRRRWCGGCAKQHRGAIDISFKKCEGCGVKAACFGELHNRRRQWCSSCAKHHPSATDLNKRRCESCQLKQASFGFPSECKRRGGALSIAALTTSCKHSLPHGDLLHQVC
eukprot:SAG11_NODE_6898_length_1229_cov_1.825664_1_plen_154_part_00